MKSIDCYDVFNTLENDELYYAAYEWDCVTDEMRRQALEKLKGKWFDLAILDWQAIR